MGWKNVKNYYRISHIVKVIPDRGICIGSQYIHDCIVIGTDGRIVKRTDYNDVNLKRYQAEMDADPVKLKELVQSQDFFCRSVAVYTYEGGEIIEKTCEALGWPNVTHDGLVMYQNTFSSDRAQVFRWATTDAKVHLKFLAEDIEQAEAKLAELRTEQAQAVADLEKLKGTS